MPEIISMTSEKVEIQFTDAGCVVTIVACHDEGDYFVASADWLATGGIDLWDSAYIGVAESELEAWQRVYAYMNI